MKKSDKEKVLQTKLPNTITLRKPKMLNAYRMIEGLQIDAKNNSLK